MFLLKKGLIFGIGIIWILAASALAVNEGTAVFPPANPPKPDYANLKYPQIAEVTGDDVYIRSGPGTINYYSGKLNRGSKVTIVDIQENGWAKILPPAGSYSWIAKKYVQVTPENPMVGVVNMDEEGAGARVWAGSDFVEPLHSNRQQVKLYRGDMVELAAPGNENDDYYKIKPPSGAYLYISMDYVKLLGTPEEIAAAQTTAEPQGPVTEPSQLPMDETTEPAPIEEFAQGAEPQAPAAPQEAPPAPAVKSAETLAMERVKELSEMIDQELKKPLMSQDYKVIKEALTAIQTDPQSGKAQIYAQLLIDRVGRYELAAEVNKQLVDQEENLENTLTQIDRAHQAQRQQIAARDIPYLFVGTVKPSHVYTGKTGSKRYLLTDDMGRILCYALPGNADVQTQMDMLINQKAGIQGTIMSDPRAIITTVLVGVVEPIHDGAGRQTPAEAPQQ